MKEENKNGILNKEGMNANPFKVPDGYFESLTDRLTDRIREEQTPQKLSAWKIIRPQLALAAAILGFALVSFALVRIFTAGNSSGEIYDLATLEKMGYFYDESTLASIASSEADSLTEEDLWVDDAIDYLADNDISFYQLLDELEN